MSSWLSEYEQAESTSRDVTRALGERAQAQRNGTAVPAWVSGQIRTGLATLTSSIKDLGDQLRDMEDRPSRFNVTRAELQRRKDLLRQLTSTKAKLTKQDKAGTTTAEKSHLLGQPAASRGSPGAMGAGSSGGRGAREVMMSQAQEMKDQDAMLESLDKGVSSLRHMGEAINTETELHLRLLDDIEDETERATKGLKREARRAEHIIQYDAACWMYVAICLLILLMLALIIVKLTG